MSAIVIEHFSKNYHGNTVVSDLSLQVAEGEIFGFIGPNGAGKSTTIKALLDFIKPSTGTLAIFGMDTQKEALIRILMEMILTGCGRIIPLINALILSISR